MLDIKNLKVDDIFYYVHENEWFFTLQVITLPDKKNKNIICRHLTKEEKYIGKIEPFSTEDIQEYFSTYEQANASYLNYINQKKENLSNSDFLLNHLYDLAKENISCQDQKLYREAIQNLKERL